MKVHNINFLRTIRKIVHSNHLYRIRIHTIDIYIIHTNVEMKVHNINFLRMIRKILRSNHLYRIRIHTIDTYVIHTKCIPTMPSIYYRKKTKTKSFLYTSIYMFMLTHIFSLWIRFSDSIEAKCNETHNNKTSTIQLHYYILIDIERIFTRS